MEKRRNRLCWWKLNYRFSFSSPAQCILRWIPFCPRIIAQSPCTQCNPLQWTLLLVYPPLALVISHPNYLNSQDLSQTEICTMCAVSAIMSLFRILSPPCFVKGGFHPGFNQPHSHLSCSPVLNSGILVRSKEKAMNPYYFRSNIGIIIHRVV